MRARSGPDSVARYRAAFAERDLVAEIEALAARAWPPLTLLDVDGWQLRSAGGLSRRANSAWPRAEGTRLDLDQRLAQVEAFYRQARLDPSVQLSPSTRPRDLESALRARGYTPTPLVEVRTRRADVLGDLGPPAVLLPVEGWLERWVTAAGASSHQRRMAERMLDRTRPEAAYAVVAADGEVAVARGVVDGGWLGLDLLAATAPLTNPAAGAALAAALGHWGATRGAERAWLEVDEDDPAGKALTRALGFRRAFAYRYLVKPLALARR
jgi:N-acetylglutamate synthase